MNSFAACMLGAANRGREQKVFDWDKAAHLIKMYGVKEAGAGLRGDYGNTGGDIFYEGKPVINSYTYLASTWATPIIKLWDYENGFGESGCPELELECWKMKSETPGWNYDTKWPQSALDILGGTNK